MSGGTERLAAGATFTLADVLAATGGELARLGAAVDVRGLATDTRTLEPGELFVAVRGDAHDGHAFLPEAERRGAGAVLVERGTDLGDLRCTVIVVRETLAALGDVAALHRRRHPIPLLAVAGSNGKTTTKEMLATILRRAYGEAHVVATRGSQNNLVGLPLTLLRVGSETRVAVLEIGMNAPGEVWRLAEIAQPDVGLITCIAEEHLQGVGSIRGAAEANAELYRRLRPTGTAVVNADDPWVRAVAGAFEGRRVLFGDGGTVRARDVVDDGVGGTRFVLDAAGETRPVQLRVAGRHNVSNALAATAAARAVGVPLETIAAGLESFEAPTMRMQVVQLASGVTVLNDCYNANPGSMAAALQTLGASRATRRIAALGEMLELGPGAADAHRELGTRAAAAGLDLLVLVGTHAERVREGALAGGLAPERIVIADGHEGMARDLATILRGGDLLLLKGSRGAALERVLRALQGEPGA
ncbi:MAG TPA: UDP-N-acetylmuramoyl-tripeptide--D-alanyl-D-alanine ligase [Candidatus Eisenbacteria bacterium]|nr:UDP-N-acetylmuramoyl-tripeptide--D-alanyl-D-alanine ligase [Candidatus Eisenbacteria bacterium]